MDIDRRSDLTSAILARHSCRGFLPHPVPRSTLEPVLKLAQHTASWCNSQAWQLHITEGPATERFRAALSAHAASHLTGQVIPDSFADFPTPEKYDGVYATRRKECGAALYASMGIARGDRLAAAQAMQRNFELFGAPNFMLVTTPRDLGTYGAVDCGGFVSIFMTVAQAHGIATIAQGAIAIYAPFVRSYFQIPQDRLILCGISFGYEDSNAPANQFRTTRATIDEVVTWDTD